MRSIVYWVCIFSSLQGFSQSVNFATDRIPSEMLSDAHSVVRNSSFKFTVKSPSSASYHVRCLITILSEESPFSQVTVGYDKYRKIKDIGAKVYNKAGALIKEVDRKEVKDYSAISDFSIYEDNRILLIDLHHSEYPYTIEYEYDVELSAIFGYPDWQPQYYGTSVEKSSYTLVLPENMAVNIKECNGVSPAKRSDETKGKTGMEWQIENLAAIKREIYGPNEEEIFPMLMLSPADFEIEGNSGSMDTWENFSAFLHQLNTGTDELSAEMKTRIATLTSGMTTREKIDALYKYLQSTMRYVSVQLGVGGWRSFDAEYVEQNKYGDCKALSTFMKAMLTEIGVESHCAIIQSGAKKSTIPEDLAQSFFNHQIVYIPSENEWLECTSTSAPRGYIGFNNSDRKALLIKEKGGKLVSTPKYGPQENWQHGIQTISLSENGSAAIKLTRDAFGPAQDALRYIGNNYDRSEQTKWLVKNICTGASIEISDMEITSEPTHAKSSLLLVGTSNRFGSKSGKRLFAPVFVFNRFENPLPKSTTRKLPLQFARSYSHIDTITLSIPPGFGIESSPQEETVIQSDFGSYQLIATSDDTKIHLVRKLVVDTNNVAAERYEEIYDFFQKIERIENTKVVLIKRDS